MTACPALWIPPGIIAPRFGSWWRLPHFLTAGKVQRKDSTGKVKRKTNGKVARNSATNTVCCCNPCTVCSSAGNPTPATYTITLSGLTNCSGCVGAPHLWFNWTGDINGTYTLPRDLASSLGCDYVLTDTGVTIDGFSDFGCTVPFATYNLAITIRVLGGGFLVQANTVPFGPGAALFFKQTKTTASDCPSTPTTGITNKLTACPDPFEGTTLSYGGTADITPNF